MSSKVSINTKKYWHIFTISFRHSIKDYKSLIGLSFFLIVCMLIFANLWDVIASKTKLLQLNATQLLWYIALNEWVLIALPRPEREMEIDLKTGNLAYLLPKPVSYLGAIFCETLGKYSVNLVVLGVVTFSFTYLWVGLPLLPLSAYFILILTSIASGLIALIFQMHIGLTAFWIHEIEPIRWIWEKLLFAFGGLMLPLTAFPKLWEQLAYLTPFPWILAYRSELAIVYSPIKVATLISGIAIWLLISFCSLIFMYRKSLKILQIDGG